VVAGVAGVDQFPEVVDELARSGATTTSTSAVPMVLTGAAVVYGSTTDDGRWMVAATAVAGTFWPAT
jgi:hypothetical protein